MREHQQLISSLRAKVTDASDSDFTRLIEQSELIEIALAGNIEETKAYTRELMHSALMEFSDEIEQAMQSAKQEAIRNVRKIRR